MAIDSVANVTNRLRGSEAVARVLNTLSLSPSDFVLDVGSGLGGPARVRRL